MATRRLEDHDLDLNGHRLLASRGADLAFNADGDLIFGNGNYFVVAAATATKVLKRIATGNWLAGATVFVEFSGDGITIDPSGVASGGFSAIFTPSGGIVSIADKQVVAFAYRGDAWSVSFGAGVSDHLVKATAGDATPPGALVDKTVGVNIAIDSVTDGGVTKMRLTGAAPTVLDHLVKASNADATTVGGLSEKTTGKDGVVLGLETATDGVQRLTIGLAPVPAPPPTVYKFFPCYIDDPKKRKPARALMAYGENIGFFGGGYVQIAGISTWQATSSYALMLMDASNSSSIFARDGDVVLAMLPGTISDNIHFGLYEVLDCGIHNADGSTYDPAYSLEHHVGPTLSPPTIRRTTDANTPSGLCHGMVVQVNGGSGVEHNGDYFTLSTDDPVTPDTTEINFSISSSYTSSPKSELLSSAQVLSEGSLGEEEFATSPAASIFEPNGYQLGPTFTTLPLGLTSIPAGRFGAQMLLRNSVFTTTFVKVLWWIKHLDGSTTALAPFLTMETSTTVPYDSLYHFEADLAAPVSLVPTDCVQVAAFTHAPSIDILMGQYVTWTFQRPERPSWFTVTWQGSIVGGTNDHQDLLNRFVDVGDGTTPPEHKHDGIGPAGRSHTKQGATTATDGNGCITAPTDANFFPVSGTADLLGFATGKWLAGDRLTIFIQSDRWLVQGATVPSGFAALSLGTTYWTRTLAKAGTLWTFRFGSAATWVLESTSAINANAREDIVAGTQASGCVRLPLDGSGNVLGRGQPHVIRVSLVNPFAGIDKGYFSDGQKVDVLITGGDVPLSAQHMGTVPSWAAPLFMHSKGGGGTGRGELVASHPAVVHFMRVDDGTNDYFLQCGVTES